MSNRFKSNSLYRKQKPAYRDMHMGPDGSLVTSPYAIRIFKPHPAGNLTFRWKVYADLECRVYVGTGEETCNDVDPRKCNGHCMKFAKRNAFLRMAAYAQGVPHHQYAKLVSVIYPAGGKRVDKLPADYDGPISWEMWWEDDRDQAELALVGFGTSPSPKEAELAMRVAACGALGMDPSDTGVIGMRRTDVEEGNE